MKRHLALTIVLTCVAVASHRSFAAAGGDFESAKALYAAASYEEALSTLNQLDGNADPIQVNEYRALCLLALGRTQDAEAPLQQIVSSNPLYTMAQADLSPRLVDLFKDVRKRTLPAAARQLYATAKASYDEKRQEDAIAQFRTLLSVLKDPVAADPASDLGDLKDLADGFLTLAEAQLAAAKAAAAPPPAPAPVAAPPAPVEQRIYSAEDRDVRAPIEIERSLPRWTPTSAMEKQLTYRGVLKLIIDEQGDVESAELVTPVYPTYNAELLRSAKTWRYQPAVRQGRPVKYAATLEIVLRPSGSQDHE
jgi:tetratricopeptide (TPR) repeat protein